MPGANDQMPSEQPLLIGHRFGNELDRLDEARAARVDLIETDVHLYKGRLEVRHMKTLGPIGLLWDGPRLGNPFAPRLQLETVMAALQPDDELMLDLKPVVDGRGSGKKMAAAIIEAREREMPGRPVTVCSRKWDYLPHFAEQESLRIVYSCGSTSERDRLLTSPRRLDGVSIRLDLITPEVGRRLRERTDLVMSWGIDDLDDLERARALGVSGIITDYPSLIRGALGD